MRDWRWDYNTAAVGEAVRDTSLILRPGIIRDLNDPSLHANFRRQWGYHCCLPDRLVRKKAALRIAY